MDELLLYRINAKYNFKIHTLNNGIFITTPFSEWYVEEITDGIYALFHKSKMDKYHFHAQRNRRREKVYSGNLENIFKYIDKHDKKLLRRKNAMPHRLEKLFQMIE